MAALRRSSISVGRRIALLVVVEALLIGGLVGHVLRGMSALSADLEYARRFVLAPAEALTSPLERIAALKAELGLSERADVSLESAELVHDLDLIEGVVRQYRTEWEASDSKSEDARRFRRDLAGLGALGLIEDERQALDVIETQLRGLRRELPALRGESDRARALEEARELQRGLRQLMHTNVRFIAANHAVHEQRAAAMRTTVLIVGLGGLVVSVLLGIHVRSAIAPRMEAMARKVRTFQETGDYERLADPGRDEITVLANALDAGLSAIRDREHERERFIAVAAHELKTPITSIRGFVQVALTTGEDSVRARALEVVRRQSDRLGRLVQDLLLAASVRHGQLAFKPRPVDVRALVIKTLGEIEDDRHRLVLREGDPVFLLADEDLIGHALWQILSYALAITVKTEHVPIEVGRAGPLVVVEVTLSKMTTSYDELERSFQPFTSVQYEGGGLRYAVGLHLSREIARVHGGTLCPTRNEGDRATLRLELPG